MIPANQPIQVACAGCRRTASLTIAVLARRGNCMYCGAAYALPPEVDEAVRAVAPTESRPRLRPPVAVSCPICAQTSRFKSDQVGQLSRCPICGCPFEVPEDDGFARPSAGKMRVPVLADLELRGAPCPSCGSPRLAAEDPLGHQALCGGCGARVPGGAMSLEILAGSLPDLASDPVLSLANYALAVRWSRGEAGLAEATLMRSAIAALHDRSRGAASDSPFDPGLTAEILQWAVFSAPGSTVARDGETVRLFLIGIEGDGPSTAALVAMNAVGIGLALATGSGFYVTRKEGREENEVAMALVLVLEPAPGGGTLLAGVEIREESGKIVPAPHGAVASIRALLQSELPQAARKYLAFQALYGIWAGGVMFRAAAEPAVARRLESMGEAIARDAASWAAFLAPGAAVKPRDL